MPGISPDSENSQVFALDDVGLKSIEDDFSIALSMFRLNAFLRDFAPMIFAGQLFDELASCIRPDPYRSGVRTLTYGDHTNRKNRACTPRTINACTSDDWTFDLAINYCQKEFVGRVKTSIWYHGTN